MVTMEHENIQELLPWYVNGTLPDAERGRVNAHVDSCLLCRRIVQRDRQLFAHLSAEPVENSTIDASFRKLMRRIDREAPTRLNLPRLELPDRASTRHAWAYAALMFIGIVVAAWLATPRGADQSAEFTTVTDRQTPSPAQLDVVFAPDLASDEPAQIIASLGARIVAGPSAMGRYTIELASEAPTESELASALERLRADRRVQFAGRNFIAPADPTTEPPR